LEYATPATDARVLYTREENRATVVIHRPGRRTKAAVESTGMFAGEGLLLLMLAGVVAVSRWSAWVLIPGIPTLFGVMFAVGWVCKSRLSRPIILELADNQLTASNLDTSPRIRHIDLEGVYEIKYVDHSKNIVIRRRGREIFEIFVTPDAAEGKRIASFLGDAAGLDPTA
jgi:hypothetical protein